MRGRREKKADGTGGQDEQALGRSRGGFGTKIHGGISGLGLPVTLALSPGQDADVTHAPELLAPVQPEVVIADKGYVGRKLRQMILAKGAVPVIPSKSNCVDPPPVDGALYRERNLVERFWAKLKRPRRVATRYEKTARDFLAFVHVVSITVLLQ